MQTNIWELPGHLMVLPNSFLSASTSQQKTQTEKGLGEEAKRRSRTWRAAETWTASTAERGGMKCVQRNPEGPDPPSDS